MASAPGNYMLFGLDLGMLAAHWRQGWADALRWPLFARLLPGLPVCRIAADGSVHGDPARAAAVALTVPENLVLRRSLDLPLLAPAAQRQAIELEIQAISPFAPEQLVWGARITPVGNAVRADLALTARASVEAQMQACADTLARTPGRSVEVWTAAEPQVIFNGFGEAQRLRREARRRWLTGGLLLLVLGLLLVLLATPVLHKRSRVIDAVAQFDALGAELAPTMARRDALARSNARIDAITAHVDARPDARAILARLTALLPDSAFLLRYEQRGQAVQITGLADNAAGVMEILGTQSDFHDLRAPAAFTRDRGSGRENFMIAFNVVAPAAGEGAQ